MAAVITTDMIRIQPGRYVRIAMGIWLGRWWWAAALPVVALAIFGLADPVWYIVALALVMLMYPMVLANVYFNAALRTLATFATIPHHISLADDRSLTIDYYRGDEIPDEPTTTKHIDHDQIASVDIQGNAIIITLRSSRYDFIVIPADSLSPENLRIFIEKLRN